MKSLLTIQIKFRFRLFILYRVYTCRFDNQVPNGKLVKKYFLVVKLAQYLFVKKIESLLHIASKKFEF